MLKLTLELSPLVSLELKSRDSSSRFHRSILFNICPCVRPNRSVDWSLCDPWVIPLTIKSSKARTGEDVSRLVEEGVELVNVVEVATDARPDEPTGLGVDLLTHVAVVVTAAVEFETRESNNSPRPGEGSSVSKNTAREDVLDCPSPPPLYNDTPDMPDPESTKESTDIDESEDDEPNDTLVAFL